jgi:hypothetical protein
MSFPKIIWQTHNYEFDELPTHLKKITKTWTNLNPSWEYKYASHTQRLKDIADYPILLDYYNKASPATQSDIWRFIVTYEHGGVYADMDSVCIKPIDHLLNNLIDCEMLVVPPSMNPGYPTNTANYAIKKQSNIMKNLLDYTQEHVYGQGNNYRHPWECFIDIVTKSDNVLYEFTAAWHTMEFKTEFNPNFYIDYYSKPIKYIDFIDKYNLEYF